MKNLVLFFVLVFILTSNTYAQEWVAYQQPVVYPTVQYQTPVYQPQPVLVYQWVPVVVQQNVVAERYCLFHRTQFFTTRPEIRYIYQPFVVYR